MITDHNPFPSYLIRYDCNFIFILRMFQCRTGPSSHCQTPLHILDREENPLPRLCLGYILQFHGLVTIFGSPIHKMYTRTFTRPVYLIHLTYPKDIVRIFANYLAPGYIGCREIIQESGTTTVTITGIGKTEHLALDIFSIHRYYTTSQ